MEATAKKSFEVQASVAQFVSPADVALVDRFDGAYRQFIRALTCCSPRMADLLSSFPGLAFALATGYGTPEAREECFELIESGAPLKTAATRLGLPMWLRKLPAEAFTAPLTALPSCPTFGRRIVSHIPDQGWRASAWFQRVLLANTLAGEGFALWVAARTKNAVRPRDINRLVLLAAWAWYSQHPDTLGHALLRKPWQPNLGYKRAIEECDAWKKRIDLAIAIGDGLEDSWLQPGKVGGYEFVPLCSLEDFIRESEAMNNCLDQYSMQVSLDATRVFSIRRRGLSVANVEIGAHEDDCSMPTIEQLRAPNNRRARPEIWQATYAWLGQQTFRPFPLSRSLDAPQAKKVARRIWKPFIATMKTRSCKGLIAKFLKSGEVYDPGLG